MAGSPPRPYRCGDRCLSLLRWPNADLRIVVANSAAALAHVVRQFMTPSRSLPLRSATSRNADHGAGWSVSREAMSLMHSPVVLAEVVARPVDRQSQSHSTRSRPSPRCPHRPAMCWRFDAYDGPSGSGVRFLRCGALCHARCPCVKGSGPLAPAMPRQRGQNGHEGGR